ncbi:MAG: DUF4213 domain-containing protein [Bacillota bacterium]
MRIGAFWTAVWSRNCGLASTVFEHEHSSGPPVLEAGNLTSMTARGLCTHALSGSLLERSVALAALNSLLEVGPRAVPGGECGGPVGGVGPGEEGGRGGSLPLRAAVA